MMPLPKTALGQIVGIIAVALVVTFGISFALLFTLSSLLPPRPSDPLDNVLAFAQAVQVLEAVPDAQRGAILPALSSAHFRVTLAEKADPCGAALDDASVMMERLRSMLPRYAGMLSARACPADATRQAAEMQVLVPISGYFVDMRFGVPGRPHAIVLSIPFLVGLLFLALVATVLSIWAAWRITRPLRQLSRAAEAFGGNISVAPLPEEGPREIRQVSAAFNRMQERISAFVRDRANMLAAISHDLQTPLTRLKLRVEFETAGEVRARMLSDIAQLQEMTRSALAFLQGQTVTEARDRIDLGALLATICDEFGEVGVMIEPGGEHSLPCLCQPMAVRRAIVNLIENARTYGNIVEVSLERVCDRAVIKVADDGPGIPDAFKAAALQPFTRLETSRSGTKGNIGLGLAIVVDVARAHGGELELDDCSPHGLLARLKLPVP